MYWSIQYFRMHIAFFWLLLHVTFFVEFFFDTLKNRKDDIPFTHVSSPLYNNTVYNFFLHIFKQSDLEFCQLLNCFLLKWCITEYFQDPITESLVLVCNCVFNEKKWIERVNIAFALSLGGRLRKHNLVII